ncbi:MAG: hypothetical protein AAFR54_12110 [Planctomycetota bacterium]
MEYTLALTWHSRGKSIDSIIKHAIESKISSHLGVGKLAVLMPGSSSFKGATLKHAIEQHLDSARFGYVHHAGLTESEDGQKKSKKKKKKKKRDSDSKRCSEEESAKGGMRHDPTCVVDSNGTVRLCHEAHLTFDDAPINVSIQTGGSSIDVGLYAKWCWKDPLCTDSTPYSFVHSYTVAVFG